MQNKSSDWFTPPPPLGSPAQAAQFSAVPVPDHNHNGINSRRISYTDLINRPTFSTPLYTGEVISNAAGANFPTGWSVNHTGTGAYTITHNLNTTAYTVQLTLGNGYGDTIAWGTKGSTSFQVLVWNPGGPAFADHDFSLMVTTQINP